MRIDELFVVVFRIWYANAEQSAILAEEWAATLARLHTSIGKYDTTHGFCDASFKNAGQKIVQPSETGKMRKTRCVHYLACREEEYFLWVTYAFGRDAMNIPIRVGFVSQIVK